MNITFAVDKDISAEQFIDILKRSTLANRRPVHDLSCMQGMVANANLVATAWENHRLVGVARSVTDFHYACYLSDLAVDVECQKQGIGKNLIELTQKQLQPNCTLILLAAPAAHTYYENLGFERHSRAWILPRDRHITGTLPGRENT